MHLIEIPERDIKIYLPTELSECDPRQYIEVSALIFYYQTGQLDYEGFRVQALYKLLNMRAIHPDREDDYKHSKIYQLSELIDSYFEENDEKQKVIKQYYIHNPIPKFRGTFWNYYGPADEFNNVTFGEYIDALEAFIDFGQTGENLYLYRLLAVMYRERALFPSKKDVRQQYDSDYLDLRAWRFRHQPIGIVFGFYLYFASIQKWMATAIIFVEGREIHLSKLFEDNDKTKRSDLPGIGMRGVLYALAESGVYGPVDAVRKANLWDVLLRMYDIVKRGADEEAALKATTKK